MSMLHRDFADALELACAPARDRQRFMCGRIARTKEIRHYAEELGIASMVNVVPAPRYNIAPSQNVEAVVSAEGELRMGPMKWGFHPPFASSAKPINARAETVAKSPMFHAAFRRRRCWILADGFYEWRKDGKVKTPLFIHLRSGKPMLLAGIWSADHEVQGRRVATTAVITCAPNELMATIHDRMPVILADAVRERWLQQDVDLDELGEMLAPCPAGELDAYEVSRVVNSPRNDSPACIAPV